MRKNALCCVGVALFVSALVGCEKKSDVAGLPAADTWSAPAAVPAIVTAAPGGMAAAPPLAMNPNDPHAGMNLNNPGAAMGMGQAGGVAELGLAPPDPMRAVDPSKFLKGTINATAETKDLITAGEVIFLSVKRPGPDGKPAGSSMAVDRVVFSGWPVQFNLTEAQAMVSGTEFAGDVVVYARADKDGDAISKQEGDIEGFVAASIPQADLVLTLDSPVR